MKAIFKLMTAVAVVSLFTTSCADLDFPIGHENGHDYVDLGLPSGTMWATRNVGADKNSDYGEYYAWGEISTKSVFSFSTCTYMDHNMNNWCGFTKYTIADGKYYYYDVKWYDENDKFIGDNKTELDDSDDVVAVKWEGKWKTPTGAQMKELIDECYWVLTTDYKGSSVSGFVVYKAKSQSDKGKNSVKYTTASVYDIETDANIFLPMSGCMSGDERYYLGESGLLWSKSLSTDDSSEAKCLYYSSYGSVSRSEETRRIGFAIRPVCVNPGE